MEILILDALIVSLNFNPGHFSHLVANFRLLADSGYLPHLYVHPSFNGMDEQNSFDKINHPRELRKLTAKVAVFWFPSLRGIVEILRLRLRFGCRIVYVFHEPFDSIRNYYKAGFGIGRIAKIVLINAVSVLTVLLSHKVVLPSSAAFNQYRKKYSRWNRNFHLIPLLFDDESNRTIDELAAKEFISYIGTVAADHAFDRFVEFVDAAVTHGWLPGRRFLIATKSTIPARERELLAKHSQTGRVVVVEGRPMTTEEINHHYERSLVVWNAYHRSMQSGVLPKAYMFGAAVIVLRRNANEFIDDGVTGILIESNEDTLEIKRAFESICSCHASFARNCREKFLGTFYYKSKLTDFQRLLED